MVFIGKQASLSQKAAELQHYSQAAQEFYITQPSLSGAIASLESELGITLFEKRGRNICFSGFLLYAVLAKRQGRSIKVHQKGRVAKQP